ncbi:unnamed protein product, partial [Discosporangium mesarthrocarpum]
FVLACFVGYQVIWNVTPALHTPLMSVTNAISGIIVIGALLQVSSPSNLVTILAGIAILIATINIAGGFLVTQRMLRIILFIMSLGGLSNQETARRGNIYGIVGMAIAVLATILATQIDDYTVLLGAVVIGGVIGVIAASKVEMTQMPELVAILHSFVGLAAVLVGVATYVDPTASYEGVEKTIHEVEIFLGVFIGAITFTGSVIAFGKLRGSISGKPLMLPGRHLMNIAGILASLWLGVMFL